MNIHAIVSEHGEGQYGLSSPQVPSLFAGTDDLKDYEPRNLPRVLAEAGAPSEYKLIVHRQEFTAFDGREWFIRCCMENSSERHERRTQTLRLFRELIKNTPQPIDSARKSITGEALFIICLHEDPMWWVSEQLEDMTGSATLVLRPRTTVCGLSMLNETHPLTNIGSPET